MRVSDALDAGAIVTQASWPDFESAVAGLMRVLVEAGCLPASLEAAAVRAVCERERLASTAMVDIGVSIPHSRLDGIDRILSALAVSSSPPVYRTSAGVPIFIVALVLSPTGVTTDHLRFLSALSLLLRSSVFRRDLRAAPDPDTALALIRSHEQI